ncbi:MAG: energy transducer TonB [Flavobacteriaceae bacterium]|nr:energy transducer TonB [Flavobacteriaceae bacterium]
MEPTTENKNKRKSLIITSILYLMMILLLAFAGLKYLDPPPESGIAINFGTTDAGSGEIETQQEVKTSPQTSTPEPTPTPTNTSESQESIEDVATQDTEDAPVIEDEKKEEETEEVQEEPEEDPVEEVEEPVEETPEPEEPVEEPEPDPQPDENVKNTMSNLFSGEENDGETDQGDGDTNQAGNQGDPDGDPNSSSYYGIGTGLDGDGNYKLGGRKAVNKTKYVQDCNETGVVVVRIEVNRQGEVIRAKAGVQGTTNSSSCLLEPAERAARNTKFNADDKAPGTQVGLITYEFRLSE